MARLDLRPYAAGDVDLWVVSDLTPGLDGSPNRVGADHVLGISPASTSLAQLTIREPVGRSLDLGTGCGVQALHLATHSDVVVATDVNERALRITRLNAALNGVGNVEVRDGSLFEPVADERYDLIATNPPFVISPATGERLVYRDSGLPGDRVVEHIVRTAPDHLTDGGWCQVLTNWVVARDRPWEERLGGWLRDGLRRVGRCSASCSTRRRTSSSGSRTPGCTARTTTSTATTPGCRGSTSRAWRRSASAGSTSAGEPTRGRDPPVPRLAARGRAAGRARRRRLGRGPRPSRSAPTACWYAATTCSRRPSASPGAEDPATVVLRQQRGLMRARRADTVEAALVGACDGDLTVGQILDALAQLLDRDAGELRADYLPVVRELVEEGFLLGG